MANKKIATWVIIGGEELPLALVRARTAEGATNVYKALTGDHCDLVHAEQAEFNKYGYYRLTPLR